MVTLDEGRLTTDLFTKPTNTHQYLHKLSCHPPHCKSTIAYSQALRLRRICSNGDTYLRRAIELKEYLVKRGYKREEVQQQIDRATSVNRTVAFIMSEEKTQIESHWWYPTIHNSKVWEEFSVTIYPPSTSRKRRRKRYLIHHWWLIDGLKILKIF